MTARLVLGALGVLVAAYGGWLALTRQDLGQLTEIAIWLGAGVLLHDVLLTALVLAAGWLGRRLLPHPWRPAATLGLLVWGSLTVVAIPVLGRFGARPDNPTLLDRPYLTAWWILTAAVLVLVALGGVAARRQSSRSAAASADRSS